MIPLLQATTVYLVIFERRRLNCDKRQNIWVKQKPTVVFTRYKWDKN